MFQPKKLNISLLFRWNHFQFLFVYIYDDYAQYKQIIIIIILTRGRTKI